MTMRTPIHPGKRLPTGGYGKVGGPAATKARRTNNGTTGTAPAASGAATRRREDDRSGPSRTASFDMQTTIGGALWPLFFDQQ